MTRAFPRSIHTLKSRVLNHARRARVTSSAAACAPRKNMSREYNVTKG